MGVVMRVPGDGVCSSQGMGDEHFRCGAWTICEAPFGRFEALSIVEGAPRFVLPLEQRVGGFA